MALEAHVEELSTKHRNLDKLIQEEESHPSVDDARIHELKRQKLLLKDRLAKLQNPQFDSR
ncbi:MAG: DUF465 domain-containing protein [Hyphomicrobiales bacterium]|nr:DUF465 domain-containing protein [Hyphomicrobiales bacterium]